MARRSAEPARSPERTSGSAPDTEAGLRFSLVNLALGVAGVLAVGLGYYLLAQGSITAAPVLLVLGYVALLPLAIIL